MSQVFPHHILIWINWILYNFSKKELWLAKNWDKHKLAFQALKGTFMHVSSLTTSIIWWKTKFFINSFLNQNMAGEDLRHAQTCVSGPETHFYTHVSGLPLPYFDLKNQFIKYLIFRQSTCLRSSPTIFWFKKPIYKVFDFSSKYAWGEDLKHA